MDAITKRPLAPKEQLGEDEAARFEDEAISRANELITMLESALAKWDVSSSKPLALKDEYEGYRKLLSRITEWEREAVLSKRRQEGLETKRERLRAYVEILKSSRVVR